MVNTEKLKDNANLRGLMEAIEEQHQKNIDLVSEIGMLRHNFSKRKHVDHIDDGRNICQASREIDKLVDKWDLPGFHRLVEMIVVDGYGILDGVQSSGKIMDDCYHAELKRHAIDEYDDDDIDTKTIWERFDPHKAGQHFREFEKWKSENFKNQEEYESYCKERYGEE